LVTSPANIEVIVDGTSRGITEVDPNAKAPGGGALSKRFLVSDVQNGRPQIEFRRECFLPAARSIDVARPNDYGLDPVTLTPAVAVVAVNSTARGATVFGHGAPRR